MQEEIIVEINKPNEKKSKKKKNKKNNKITKINKTKKFKKNKAKVLLILAVVIIALIIFASSGFFNIKDLSVEGVNRLTEEEIKSFSKIQIGENIFKTNISKIKELIKENPYVEDVNIKRIIPNKILINIEERKVKYMVPIAESYLYIDGQGNILEINSVKEEVPILIGTSTELAKLTPGDRLEKEDLIKLNTVNQICATAQNNDILDFISKIDIEDASEYKVYMESEGKIAYIGDEKDLNTKIMWVKSILQKNEGISGKIFVNMDLNNKKPYFRIEE